ncbi:LAGLIDADG family homing endonuclease [Haloarchaeobius sp. DFWS5]|uniref:LAGLIDADG family homing endonuclease n=1 Tax=Haloarchaeobius sp. DFWS5 TaxID=3446114 RepID=UPI003EBBAAA5
MAAGDNAELVDAFLEFYRDYYRDEIGTLAQNYPNEQRSLFVDWEELFQFDRDLAEDYRNQPEQLQEYAQEALRLYDLPIDVSLGQAHVRIDPLPDSTEIREIRSKDVGTLITVRGIVRKATDVKSKMEVAAFECQRCGTLTRIPQSTGNFQEPHECQGCERQGPFVLNHDQSEFVDAQKLRVQESPEGLRGGETPQALDIQIEDDITGEVTPGDHVAATGILRLEQQGNQQEKSPIFDHFMEGISVHVDDEQFEDMEITEEDKQEIVALSNEPDIYEQMVGSIAPSIFGYDQEKLAMMLQLFSGVTKHLPDGSRIRGDLHMLLIGDPGTGKSQMLGYIQNIAPRSVYTSGKGSSSAGLTAAAVRDDFGDGQQWTLEAGALVLADQGIAAVDELDKMRCVTGESIVHLGDGRISRIRDLAHELAKEGEIEGLDNGRTIRGGDLEAWTMDEDGSLVRRPITAIHEYEAPDELTEVTLETGEQLTATADHPFFVSEDGERVERPAAELEAGDWTYVPREIPSQFTDGGTMTAESASPIPENSITPALGAVLGYLAGDGNLYYDRDAGVYGIRFTNAEEELLSDFEQVCEGAFDATPIRPPSEQRDDGVQTVRLPGKSHADYVINAGMNLETYDGKRLPESVSEASRETKAAFVRALADSEASVGERHVRIHSASYELLMGVKHLLLEFGVTCQLEKRESSARDRLDLHVLTITDATSLTRFHDRIGFTLARKQESLQAAVARVSGDRTILDVIPNCGSVLKDARTSLRLYQSECGIDDATYCNFENEDANISIRLARTVLRRFETRRVTANQDLGEVTDAKWSDLDLLKSRYHISQTELAEGTAFSQQQISSKWGDSKSLKKTVRNRLTDIITSVAETDLDTFSSLVRANVKWRRVASVDSVSATGEDDRVTLLREDIAERLNCSREEAIEQAKQILSTDPGEATDWETLRTELDRYGISFQTIASDLDVAGSTVSRWFSETVQTDRFDEVRERSISRTESIRTELREKLEEIEARQGAKVYDLTVEGTHNFVANGMVVHNSEDRSAMHEALEQQKISVSKAGINATLKSRCSLLGAANPKYGRFDQYEPIGEQIELEPALISRFDLIFTVTDNPNPDKDRDLAEHIINTNYAGELHTQQTNMTNHDVDPAEVERMTEKVDPDIDPDLVRKYIAYSKQHCYPRMTEEAREAIRDFYVDLRSKGQDEDAPVPVTARKLEALVRLSEASARMRLSDTVEAEDADRVITIVRECLQNIGVDPETGEFDADVIETGTSKSQRDRIKNLKQLIGDIEEDYDDGAPVDVVMERADEIGMDHSKAEHEIEKLKQKGEVYEPRTDHLRTT